jgi:hypothetical protein
MSKEPITSPLRRLRCELWEGQDIMQWFTRTLALSLLSLVASASPTLAQKPDWQIRLDWAANDSGPPNCPAEYIAAQVPQCLAAGNRSCLMTYAIAWAKTNDDRLCYTAFGLTLITQCNNVGARNALIAAGQWNICGYLRSW